MRHLDPDLIALIALGEQVSSDGDRAHLSSCAECAAELDNLAWAATVGRTTLGAGGVTAPTTRVWSRIADELRLGDAAASVVPVASLVGRRRRRRTAFLASAAAVALLAGGGLLSWQVSRPAAPEVLAIATLDAYPGWTGAIGAATLEREADGARVVNISIDAAAGTGFREVWLVTSDATELVSLGVVRGGRGSFTVPDGIDLSRYDLVDISEEPYDGNPQHSGDSIVRGQLES